MSFFQQVGSKIHQSQTTPGSSALSRIFFDHLNGTTFNLRGSFFLAFESNGVEIFFGWILLQQQQQQQQAEKIMIACLYALAKHLLPSRVNWQMTLEFACKVHGNLPRKPHHHPKQNPPTYIHALKLWIFLQNHFFSIQLPTNPPFLKSCAFLR